MINKIQLGQFFTTNTDYILSGFEDIVKNKNITDPFAGNGDLLKWANKHQACSITGFDIDATLASNNIQFNDSILYPKKYKFVLTNPPYLYQNKLSNNSLLKNSCHTDLYHLSLEAIMDSDAGIVIVPINFLSSQNAKYIRNIFLTKFSIIKVNYFTHQVFRDTSYNVMVFYYQKNIIPTTKMQVDFNIYPQQKKQKINLYKKYNYQVGGEFLQKIGSYKNQLNIKRLEQKDMQIGKHSIKIAINHLNKKTIFLTHKKIASMIKNNIILLKAIDTGSKTGQICTEDIRQHNVDALVSKKTSRNQIYLLLPKYVSIHEQEIMIKHFNRIIQQKRDEFFSLFMTNFRDNNRKRISFNFAYKLLNYIYLTEIKIKNDYKQHKLF
ncbi:MAG: hypothetical protein DRQ51_07285 [Gammaproteobacteria bacterium]|nr:MAG: hypothetical protein DRQ51_07285 [Gammaproteobacteria bacterium]